MFYIYHCYVVFLYVVCILVLGGKRNNNLLLFCHANFVLITDVAVYEDIKLCFLLM
jgi:hypothetical protein